MQEFLHKKGWYIMSAKETKRRQIASTVFRSAWELKKRTTLFAYSFKTALFLSWRTVRKLLRFIHTKVRGTTFENRQKLLGRLRAYDYRDVIMSLVREPANAFDANAVQVWAHVRDKGSGCIGYVSKELAMEMAPQLDAGKQAVALFEGITGGGDMNFGCNFRYLLI